jgi:hypothetical protein
LATLKLRPRRGHDLRRTFITLARVDGARGDLLESMTHALRDDIISIYTTFPWPALCAEVEKLNVSVREGRFSRLTFGALLPALLPPSEKALGDPSGIRK